MSEPGAAGLGGKGVRRRGAVAVALAAHRVAVFAKILARILAGLLAGASLRGRADLALWMPIALSLGIALYFALPSEPGVALLWAGAFLAVLGLAVWVAAAEVWRFPAACVVLVLSGFLIADLRARTVAAPVLGFRYFGSVEGRVIGIDRSVRDLPRVTLGAVVLEGVAPERRPETVRIALHAPATGPPSEGFPEDFPEPGARLRLQAHLQPPPPPAEPGGWDFRRAAWFAGLGAVGYARAPPQEIAPPDAGDPMLWGFRMRMALSQAMQARMEGQPGAVAAALMTGDRSGISTATNDAMRASGLYHIVSISGLHMGMLAGFVFGAIRYGMALSGAPALWWPAKKIAALVALVAASLYLWVAGPEVATARSYLMTAVMLAAVLADRRALSLRTVAIAATVLLLLRPEGLTEPGFQMSFAATIGLILALGPWARIVPRLPRLLRPVLAPVLGLVLTSLVAGTITGPIAAAHFGRISGYGLVANMLAVPVMGALVMPAGVIAALLAPFHAAAPALWVMQEGTRWMIFVAEHVAALKGAQALVPEPPGYVLPLMGFGAAAMVPGRGAVRLAGGLAIVLAGALWCTADRPALLIAPEGQAVGLMTAEGRALSKPGAGFVTGAWLTADGDPATPETAAARPAFSGPRGIRRAEWRGVSVLHLSGKGAVGRLAEACTPGAVVVVAARVAPDLRRSFDTRCQIWDAGRLRWRGAVAYLADGRLIVTDPATGEGRLWTRPSNSRTPVLPQRANPDPVAPEAAARETSDREMSDREMSDRQSTDPKSADHDP